jgi:hypothetical protein
MAHAHPSLCVTPYLTEGEGHTTQTLEKSRRQLVERAQLDWVAAAERKARAARWADHASRSFACAVWEYAGCWHGYCCWPLFITLVCMHCMGIRSALTRCIAAVCREKRRNKLRVGRKVRAALASAKESGQLDYLQVWGQILTFVWTAIHNVWEK